MWVRFYACTTGIHGGVRYGIIARLDKGRHKASFTKIIDAKCIKIFVFGQLLRWDVMVITLAVRGVSVRFG